MMVKQILVGLDGSPLAEAILPCVSNLAKGLGAEVTLLNVTFPESIVEPEDRPSLQQLVQGAEIQAKDYLRGVAQRLQETGITTRYAVAVGDAPAEIVNYAQRGGMDLIALATHGRSGIQRWVFGSVADAVLHTTRTPLLLIRPRDGRPAAASGVTQVVVPLDGSPLAEAVLPLAQELALAFDVPVVLLRTVETVYLFSEPAPGAAAGYQDIISAVQEAVAGYLEHVGAGLEAQGTTVKTVAPLGSPATEIEAYTTAHEGSLVVMATHGRTGIGGLLLGSVARRVVQQSGAPVLLVRPAPPLVIPA